MKKPGWMGMIYWIFFGLWAACAFGLLAMGLLSYSDVTAGETPVMLGERRMVVHIGMTILGFPTNMVAPWYFSDLLKPYGFDLFSVSQPSAVLFTLDWMILFIFGWLQWFVVVPVVVRCLIGMRKAAGLTNETR